MNKKIPAFFGHHKCGSTWIMKVISQVCRHMGIQHDHYYSPKKWGYSKDRKNTLDKVIYDLNSDFIGYTGADLRYIGDINKFCGVHIIRDPRDIVTSAYFSHLHSHSTSGWPELAKFRKEIGNMSKEEGFLLNIDFTSRLPVDGLDLDLFKSMEEWNYKTSNILEMKYEDIIINPYKSFIQIFDHFGFTEHVNINVVNIIYHTLFDSMQKGLRFINLPIKNKKIPEWYIMYCVYSNDFSRLAKGRSQGQENTKSHFRKGISGDWKNHFNDNHKDYFKKHYNEILIKLGYENDDKW